MRGSKCFALILVVALACVPVSAFSADSTSFNPVPITVMAKGGGGVPVGTVIAWPVATNPEDMDNWLECNGQAISAAAYPELVASVGARVPDYRGLFLRGVGGNSAALGVRQAEESRVILPVRYTGWSGLSGAHTFSHATTLSPGFQWNPGPIYEEYRSYGGSENRPANTAVRYLIRAKP